MNQVDDGLIDRLVDGELDEAERQRLLTRLETEAGGWRRCALAFLEAQTWSRTFALVDVGRNGMTTTASIDLDRPANLICPRQAPMLRRFQTAGILAAGILLSFATGWIASRATRPFTPAPAPLANTRGAEVLTSTTVPKPALDQGRESTEPVEPSHPLVPKAEAPLVLTEPVRRELERQGYLVQQRSGLVSMELENGQSLAVPVDEVELRYVGDRTY